ncbi:hypothetical protein [Bradyrhizobium sp. USDA 4502]
MTAIQDYCEKCSTDSRSWIGKPVVAISRSGNLLLLLPSLPGNFTELVDLGLFAVRSGDFVMIQKPSDLNPQKIFEHAGKFQWTDERLRKTDIAKSETEIWYLGDPCLVISALASELYFKCLLVIFGTPFAELRRLHNLFDLYQKLPPQDRIKALWDHEIWEQGPREMLDQFQAKIGKDTIPRNFTTLLKFGANTFVDLRYVYEKPRNVNNVIVTLPSILRKVIAEIHPEWL